MKPGRLINLSLMLLVTGLFLPVSSVGAEGAVDIDTVVSMLQSRYETVSTFSADFTQEFFSAAMGNTQVSGGRVHLKKPGRMRWEYTSGIGDVFVSNGAVVWLFQPDLNQVIETARPARSVASQSPGIAIDFLSGVGDIRKNFTVRLLQEGGGESAHLLELTPATVQPNLKRLVLEVDMETSLVIKTIVEDLFGNRTTVSFSDISVNVRIDDSFFEFVAPDGVNILKQ